MHSRKYTSPSLPGLSPAPDSWALLAHGAANQVSLELPQAVRPEEMQQLLEDWSPHITTLSLDCFDTLLWRHTRTPVDVFYALQSSPAYVRHHITAKLRISAEARARSLKLVQTQKSEVTLDEVYRVLLPHAAPSELGELRAAELQAEIALCYPFPRVVELMRQAKSNGLKLIVVSDTYFTETELCALLEARLPADVYAAIDRVFCSNTTGRPKAGGLFDDVLEALREKPERILHLGDNRHADLLGARQAGLLGVEFTAFEDHVAEVLRQSATGAALCCPEVRASAPLTSPYHGLFCDRAQPTSGEHALGYLGTGPILFAFAERIKHRIDELSAEGKRVKPVFLMRDGHLPERVFSLLFPEVHATRLSVSRFAAYAASFVDHAAIVDYLSRSAGSTRFEAMLKQLLVPDKLAQVILKHTRKASRPQQEFTKQVQKPQVIAAIMEESARFRTRFLRYLDRELGPSAGDTLLFVDLGYEGTAQRCLAPVLKQERGTEVLGCYLLASSVPGWQEDRVGLLDPSWCDDRALAALVPYVAVLEDICTACMPSVRDYTSDGAPVFEQQMVSATQFEKIAAVQTSCEHFARDAADFFTRAAGLPTPAQLRLAAAGFLTRLLFFPSLAEVEYLDGFALDMGLGTQDVFPLFDRSAGLVGLRKRGLFFMEHGQTALRMNYPVELRSAALELSLTAFAQKRFSLDIALHDLTLRRLSLPVLVLNGQQASNIECTLQATFDGYFSAIVPVGACVFDLGFLLGKLGTFVQLSGLDLIPTDHLYSDDESRHTQNLLDEVVLEGLSTLGDGILQADHDAAFVFVSPRPHQDGARTFALRITLRPLSSPR